MLSLSVKNFRTSFQTKNVSLGHKQTCQCQVFQWNLTRWMAKDDSRVSHPSLCAREGKHITFRNREKRSEILFYFSHPRSHFTIIRVSICLSARPTLHPFVRFPLLRVAFLFYFPTVLFLFSFVILQSSLSLSFFFSLLSRRINPALWVSRKLAHDASTFVSPEHEIRSSISASRVSSW